MRKKRIVFFSLLLFLLLYFFSVWSKKEKSNLDSAENSNLENEPTPETSFLSAIKPQPEQETLLYYGNKNSNKYHLASCHHTKNIADKNKIEFSSVKEAEAKGYFACGFCIPK